jgi:homogentisate 1,2-dioxygenase
MGEDGFSGASSLLYHRRSPSALRSAEAVTVRRASPEPNEALEPFHLRLRDLPGGGDAVLGRHVVLGNGDLTMAWVRADRPTALYRNAAGAELAFVLTGHGVLESVFGRLAVGPGDYVVVPPGTTQRWLIEGEQMDGAGQARRHTEALEMLILEANGHIAVPQRYLTATGQLVEGAPYSERDFRLPHGPVLEEGEDVPVLIRHRAGWARHVHRHHPFDVVGWVGCLYPFAFSIGDFEPIVGRIHQPPPVHQTFAGRAFVVCSFVPRLLDFDPHAVRVPYHHSNVDCDEVLFYVAGNFLSRTGSGIASGSLTLHPAGFVHGPQPGSAQAASGQTRTEETAVMIDTFRPLGVTGTAREVADPAYLESWSGPAVQAR